MIQKKTLLIGLGFLLFLLGAFAPNLAHAQETPSANCGASLYDNEFVCDSANVRSFCSTTALADETPDALVDTSSALAYYKSSYCNVQRDSDDEVIAAVAEQMKVEDPKWDEELVRMTLTYLTGPTLQEFAGGASDEQLAKLPATLVEAYIKSPNFEGQTNVYNWVKSAYEKEKVMAQSKASLKQQFKGREMWANGSLSDAPFDLIVDLNLIEIVMFGSQAKWMDDVYKFPPKTGGAGIGIGVGTPADSGTTPPGSTAPAGETPQAPEGQETGDNPPVQPDTITCVSDVPPGEDVIPVFEPPINCGNGKIDEGEECDDRNTKAGDGCNETCKNEPGNTLSCRDPQAVTLKPFVAKPAQPSTAPMGQDAGNVQEPVSANVPQTGIPIDCPPGTTPTVEPPPQSPNYPGPDVGGVLKVFPPSKKPDCGEGMSAAEITILGETHSRCVPTSACGGYEDARKLIFGEHYMDDPETAKAAETLEAFVCIKVLKVQRPESPYPVNEGCIDCHVLGMNDLMSKLLENNVSCLENSMQAWGLSNRWGPKVAFNLDVVQSISANWLRRKLGGLKSDHTPQEEVQLRSQQILQDATHKLDPNRAADTPTVSTLQDTEEILNREARAKELEKIAVNQGLRFYRVASESEGVDQKFNSSVSTMLEQMSKSFGRLQDLYVSLATGLKFKEKEECTFD